MARLKDIAEQTGLSVNTVSLALRDSPRIPPDTREKIRLAAAALDYTPNYSARALVSRQTKTVGLLLTDITSPLLTQVARSVEQELKDLGYVTLLAASNGDPKEELRALATFRARQVDGMLVYPHDHSRLDHLRRLRVGGTPMVLLAGNCEGDVDVICLDEQAGALRATRHLIEAGHRRIGLVDGAYLRGNPAKTEGYKEALRAAGIEPSPKLVIDPEGHSVGHGHRAFARLMALAEPPTAVLTANDRLALGGLRWCQEKGVAVPHDVAVFGFDNIEYAEYASVPLSSVDYPSDDLARKAVARLITLISDRDQSLLPELVRIQPELILRESTRSRP
ncbi:LacI family transcriptional regulator [Rubellimicrobium rubrum]|uniref:LacI family transcriptional regulator n=1 Tax=Rubellimicrobium rubrum TaxID=2585369 RepID=A0A5C4N2P1_9RHOB|nr:LacI family DNA-binding transcriptional regulator [Rubellimicrobium rubrum]TNC51654.1 LacI family transcriptional regulator [Rubellimicrobium rubrum]